MGEPPEHHLSEEISLFLTHLSDVLFQKEKQVEGPDLLRVCNAHIPDSNDRCGLLDGHANSHVPKAQMRRVRMTPDQERAVIIRMIDGPEGGS